MTKLGQCFGCPLQERKRVPFTGPKTALVAIVGEAPGKKEVSKGKPFIGSSGELLDVVLEQLEIPRHQLRIGNVCLCGPITEEDKKEKWFPDVLARCSARREEEEDLGEVKYVVALGAVAASALLEQKILLGGRTPMRGAVFTDRASRIIVPTWHPAAILRSGGSDSGSGLSDADLETLAFDIRKVWKLSRREMELFEPEPLLLSDPMEFVKQTLQVQDRVAIDVETSSPDPLTCHLLSVGLAYAKNDELVCCSFWWPNSDSDSLGALRSLLDDESIAKVWHNCQFDVTVLEREVGPVSGPFSDTLLLSHARFPDCKLDLGSVAQTHLAIPAWKAKYRSDDRGKRGWEEARIMELLRYNALDAAATFAVEPYLIEECKKEETDLAAAIDIALARVAQKMYVKGVWINPEERSRIHKETRDRLDRIKGEFDASLPKWIAESADKKAAKELETKIAKTGFNLNSQDMLRLLFDVCGVKVPASKHSITATGQRSMGKKALAAISDDSLVQQISQYKQTRRTLSVFFEKEEKAKDVIQTGLFESEKVEEVEEKLALGPDGRLHVPWKIHGTPTGRWASGADNDSVVSINLQNWQNYMKAMICAPPGYMLVGADMSQLEYRIIALLSGEETLLDLFNSPEKPDLHSTNAARLYGTAWDMVDPEKASEPKEKERRKKQRKLLRKATKTGLYGAFYFGSASTIQANLRAEALREDDPETAAYLRNMPIQQCQKFVDSIPKLWPKAEAFRQRRAIEVAEACMWVAPLSGRKRFWPLAMVDKTKCFNNTIQAMAGDIMNWRTLELARVLPKGADIILQVHDSIVIECPEEMAVEVRKILEETLTVTLKIGGHSCLFPVESAVGKSGSEV